MKKILIGTHNKGKFKEISFLLSKKIKKVSPTELKIRSPKETGKRFQKILNLRQNIFQSIQIYQLSLMTLVFALMLLIKNLEYFLQDGQKNVAVFIKQ